MRARLAWNSLYSLGWLWTSSDPPASARFCIEGLSTWWQSDFFVGSLPCGVTIWVIGTGYLTRICPLPYLVVACVSPQQTGKLLTVAAVRSARRPSKLRRKIPNQAPPFMLPFPINHILAPVWSWTQNLKSSKINCFGSTGKHHNSGSSPSTSHCLLIAGGLQEDPSALQCSEPGSHLE